MKERGGAPASFLMLAYPTLQLLAMLPSVDTFTTWVKLIVQLILLLTALLQAHSIWLERRKKSK